MIRLLAAWLALVLAQPALAQPAPAPSPAPAAASPQPAAKPAQKKPVPPKPAGTGAAQPAGPGGPCIGVISHLGDYIALKRIGFTVFGNEEKDTPMSLGLDDLVVARVRAAAGPRFAVRRISFGKDAFQAYDHPEIKLFGSSEDNLKTVVQGIAQSSRCERYVVVVRFTRGAIAGTNQAITGIGIVNFGALGLDRTWAHAITGIRVYDGRTFTILKKGTGTMANRNLLTDALPVPHRKLDKFPWPPTPEALAGAREQVRSLLAESLDTSLPEVLAP